MSLPAPDILLVEDNANDAELVMIAHRLNKSAYTINVVRDGVAALDFLLSGGTGSESAQRQGQTGTCNAFISPFPTCPATESERSNLTSKNAE
jgi:CheY-like chemotaxis protein